MSSENDKDPNIRLEYIAERMWYDYCKRVSGKYWADRQPWDDVGSETATIYLNHAKSAIRAMSEMAQADAAVKLLFPKV